MVSRESRLDNENMRENRDSMSLNCSWFLKIQEMYHFLYKIPGLSFLPKLLGFSKMGTLCVKHRVALTFVGHLYKYSHIVVRLPTLELIVKEHNFFFVITLDRI